MKVHIPSDFTVRIALKDMQGNPIGINTFRRATFEFSCVPATGIRYVASYAHADSAEDNKMNHTYSEGNNIYVTIEDYSLKGQLRVRNMIERDDTHYIDDNSETWSDWQLLDIVLE